MNFCQKCGKEIKDDCKFCPVCGTEQLSDEKSSAQLSVEKKEKCLPSFIIGLIGSILGMFGGLCTTMCSCGSSSNSAFLLIFLGSIVGMIGTCLCLNKSKIGSLLQLLGAVMMIIHAYSKGAEFLTVFGFVLLLFAGIIGVIYSFLIRRNK